MLIIIVRLFCCKLASQREICVPLYASENPGNGITSEKTQAIETVQKVACSKLGFALQQCCFSTNKLGNLIYTLKLLSQHSNSDWWNAALWSYTSRWNTFFCVCAKHGLHFFLFINTWQADTHTHLTHTHTHTHTHMHAHTHRPTTIILLWYVR